MPESAHNDREYEHSATLSSEEMLSHWVSQEGDRYAPLLVERGFLRPDETNNPVRIREATKTWRKTYLEHLDISNKQWNKETIAQPHDVLQWRLGGWRGWKGYRMPEATVTTFADVAAGIAEKKPGIPHGHDKKIPDLASIISDALRGGEVFVLRCAGQTAVLEGTHRISAIAYAIMQHLPAPHDFSVYVCELPAEQLAEFTKFCDDLPISYGEYYQSIQN